MKFLKSALPLLLIAFLLLCGCAPGENAKSAVSTANVKLGQGEFVYFFARTVDSTSASGNKAPNSFKPLKDQLYDEGITWFDAMLSTTLDYVKQVILLCEAACEANVELTAEDGADVAIADFKKQCEAKYGVSFEAYLEVSFHGYTDETAYANAVKLEMLAKKYMAILREEIHGGITDSRIAEYKAQNGIADDDTLTRNLMIIYLGKNGEARANTVVSALNESGISEESFASLAKRHSDISEYLYENCARGDMSALVDSWLYADGRKAGDTGVLKDGDTAFVVYYYGEGKTVSDWEAALAIADADYRAALAALAEKFPITVNEDLLRSLDI